MKQQILTFEKLDLHFRCEVTEISRWTERLRYEWSAARARWETLCVEYELVLRRSSMFNPPTLCCAFSPDQNTHRSSLSNSLHDEDVLRPLRGSSSLTLTLFQRLYCLLHVMSNQCRVIFKVLLLIKPLNNVPTIMLTLHLFWCELWCSEKLSARRPADLKQYQPLVSFLFFLLLRRFLFELRLRTSHL